MAPMMIAGAMQMVGGAVAAYGTLEASRMNARLKREQASFLNAQGADALVQAKEAEQDLIKQGEVMRSDQRASYASQGVAVDSGSAIAVQDDTRVTAQDMGDQAQLAGMRQAWGYNMQAHMARREADVIQRTGRYQAAATLLGGTMQGGATMASSK